MDNTMKKEIKLWSPDASANWSLLFSIIFGAWLHAKNWEELGEFKKAKKSMLWVYSGITILIVNMIIVELIDKSFFAIFFWLLLIWYFLCARKQVKYIKDNNIKYKKRTIYKPLGIALLANLLLGILIISFDASEKSLENKIETASVEIVSEILNNQLKNDANCKAVSIIKKITDTFYHAKAYLDNGNEIKIAIEIKGESILVTIPQDSQETNIEEKMETLIEASDAHKALEKAGLDTTPRLIELIKQTASIQLLLINERNYRQSIIKEVVTEELVRNICSQFYNGGFCEGDTPKDILDFGREEIDSELLEKSKNNNTFDEPIFSEHTNVEQKMLNEIPIKISRELESGVDRIFNTFYNREYIVITSIVDSITIQDVIINKGNCKKYSSNKILKYGEFIKVRKPSNCTLLRVNVVTNENTWTLEI